MSVEEKVELNETCDSCGCFAEIGTIIGEGDDVMELVMRPLQKPTLAPSWPPTRRWPSRSLPKPRAAANSVRAPTA